MTTLKLDEVLAFYKSSYDVISRYVLDRSFQPPVGASKPRRCRYCLRTSLETSFSKVAHTIPSLFGNTTLFSLDECAVCNRRFGLLEDDLGKFTMPSRALGRVSSYAGVPVQKFRSGARVEVDQTGNLHVTHGRDDPLIESDPATKTLRMRFELQAFRPLAVYKAFVKMAYGVMPAVEAADLDACRQWLDSDGVTACLPDKAFFPYLFEIQTGFIAQHPSIAVFRRKRTAETSYATAVVRAGHCTYQVFLPAPLQDGEVLKSGKPFLPFPPAIPISREETTARFNLHTLAEPNRVRGQVREQAFNYDSIEEVIGA